MSPGFVHLNLHSEFSLVDGILRIGPLIERTKALGMPAVAVTDRANLFCMVRFYRAAVAAGIKPIIGVDLPLEKESNDIPAGHLTLLAMNGTGYRQLARLLTLSYMAERSTGAPVALRPWLNECAQGVIAISPGPGGDIGQALLHGRAADAERRANAWASVFPGRFYLGVQRTGRPDDAPCLESTVELALETGLPVVAGNDVRFLERGDFEAHEARVCIQEGRILADPRRPRTYSEEQYLKSPQEMAALFDDLPEALENAVEIARRCSLEVCFSAAAISPSFRFRKGATSTSGSPSSHGRDSTAGFAHRRTGLARSTPVGTRRHIAGGWRKSSTSSAGWDTRDTSSSSPISSGGRGSIEFRSGRAAAPGPDRSLPTRSGSPTSIRSGTTCCSSVF